MPHCCPTSSTAFLGHFGAPLNSNRKNQKPHLTPYSARRYADLKTRLPDTTGSRFGRKAAWPEVQEKLKCSEDYLQFISTHSTAPRHGDRISIPGNITAEVVTRTWRIMEFRKRG